MRDHESLREREKESEIEDFAFYDIDKGREGKISKLGMLLVTISISLSTCLSSVFVCKFLGFKKKEQKDQKTSQFYTYL
jgi:hypothetical protein